MGRKRKADTQQEQAPKTSPERNLEEKFVRRTNESPSDFSYKAKYFETQKKLEALLEQHYEVVRKLEFANGKIQVYESMKDALTVQREVILVSATEQTVRKSSQPGPTCIAPPPPPAATIPEISKRKNSRVTFQEPGQA